MAKPFESRIQDLVYNVEVGVGLRIIKGILYIFFILAVMVMYTANEFQGLREPEAMEYAQLARNLSQPAVTTVTTEGAEQKVKLPYRFYTKVVRPVDLWFLLKKSDHGKPMMVGHPDTRHAPVYPAALATVFKMANPEFAYSVASNKYSAERPIIVFGLLCTLITGIFTWLLARRLFDGRVGLLAMTLFFLSDSVWGNAVSGLPTTFLMTTAVAAFYFSVLAVTNSREGAAGFKIMLPIACSCILMLIAFLTRYAAIALLPGLMLFYIFGMARRGWIPALLLVVAIVAGSLPWFMRNKEVSGAYFGIAPYAALYNTSAFPGDELERNLNPEDVFKDRDKVVKGIRQAFMGRLGPGFRAVTTDLGEGFLPFMFFATFFYAFLRPQVNMLRWGSAATLLMIMLVAAGFGESVWRLTAMVWPVAIIFGCAFFYILLDRAAFEIKLLNILTTAGLIVLCSLPLIFTLLPPRKDAPYPPYRQVGYVSNMLTNDELMSTDIPHATAWYGDLTSVHLPNNLDDFYNINDYIKRISGLYVTPVTTSEPFSEGMVTMIQQTGNAWSPLLFGRIPQDFPLREVVPMMNYEQLFYTDRARWRE